MSNKINTFTEITEEHVKHWCNGVLSDYTLGYLTEILNGEYSLKEAREDLIGIINSEKYGIKDCNKC